MLTLKSRKSSNLQSSKILKKKLNKVDGRPLQKSNKTLKKEIRKTLEDGKTSHVHGSGELIL
jgi:hypothetical protein